MPTAYSYIRFSSKKQEQNDSVRRQTRLRDDWLRHHPEVTLDTTISLQDLGVSAFRGRNLDPDWGDLGKFIDLAERFESPIEKGSYLLLERLDRFSRQRVSIAYTALVRLVHAGIKVVVLDPSPHQIDKENVDQLHIVLPIVTNLCLAHEQSREKSKRVSHAWVSRREDARLGKKIYTKRTPAWIRFDKNSKSLQLNEESADAIRYIFQRTADGIGQVVLVRELNARFKPIAPLRPGYNKPRWNTSYLCKILNDRSVIGEFQPHKLIEGKIRVPDGDPIKDYFPRVISDSLFYQAQYQKSLRKKEKRNSHSFFINLFTSIVFNYSDKQVMQIQASRTKRGSGEVYVQRRLVSYGNRRGISGSCPWGLDYYPFETAILNALSELNPDDFSEPFIASEERAKLQQHIDGIELKIKELEGSLLDINSRDSASRIARVIDSLQRNKEIAIRQLEALVGLSDSSSRELVDGLKSIASICGKPDDTSQQNIRNKIRGIIPTIIDRIDVLLFKRPNRTVLAKAKMILRNGHERLVSIRKTAAWKGLKNIVYFNEKKIPVYMICPVGSVLWSPWHGEGNASQIDLSDDAIKKSVMEWHGIAWVSIDGKMQRITDFYFRLLKDYLQDEEEDFEQSAVLVDPTAGT